MGRWRDARSSINVDKEEPSLRKARKMNVVMAM
jgi:hypothetical protein